MLIQYYKRDIWHVSLTAGCTGALPTYYKSNKNENPQIEFYLRVYLFSARKKSTV